MKSLETRRWELMKLRENVLGKNARIAMNRPVGMPPRKYAKTLTVPTSILIYQPMKLREKLRELSARLSRQVCQENLTPTSIWKTGVFKSSTALPPHSAPPMKLHTSE